MSRRAWKGRRAARWVAAAAALVLGVWLLSRVAPGALFAVQAPLVSLGSAITRVWEDRFASAESLRAEVQRLDAALAELAVDRVELEALRAENENLRAQLSFVDRQSYAHVTTRVVSRSISPLSATFVIDRGSADGVVVGAPVVVADGMFVGKVIAVYGGSAVVRAVIDREASVAVSLLNESRTVGIAQGTTGAILNLRYIPQDEVVEVNDLVVTSGLEETVPPGLIVGIVNEVTQDRSAPFQEASVEPLIDFREYDVVSVLVLNVL